MRIGLVSSSYLPSTGPLERHVHELALGLTRQGVEVEVLTQDARGHLPAVSEFDGFIVRRFGAMFGGAQLAVAPGLWDHLRRTAATFDLVHLHSAHAPFVLAAARVRAPVLVFTPHVPALHLVRRPYGSAIRALIAGGAHTLCATNAESAVLRALLPSAADRIGVAPQGVDIDAIEAARPFAHPGTVVVTVGGLDRHRRTDRAIAAMAALEPAFRLAVVGDGPCRDRLLAHAADLRVSSRVNFVGAVADAEAYRWLRTARVVVALAEQEYSGLYLTEALCAGAQIVASDIPVHREVASATGGAGVTFVSAAGSPLDVADRISEAAGPSLPEASRVEVATWEDTVERSLAAYSDAIRGVRRIAVVGA